MNHYYYDDQHGVAYKVDPIITSFIQGQEDAGMIVVQTDVKVTNLKKEKIRRTLMETYPVEVYDEKAAKEEFLNSRLMTFINGAKVIAENEYENIKSRYEAV